MCIQRTEQEKRLEKEEIEQILDTLSCILCKDILPLLPFQNHFCTTRELGSELNVVTINKNDETKGR